MTNKNLARRIGMYLTALGAVAVFTLAVALVFAARGDDMPASTEAPPKKRTSKSRSKYRKRGKTGEHARRRPDRTGERPAYTPPPATTSGVKPSKATSETQPIAAKSPLKLNPKFKPNLRIGAAAGLSPEERQRRRAERQKRQVENLKKRIKSLSERIERARGDGSRSEHHIKRMEMSLDRMKNRLQRLEKNLQEGEGAQEK